MHAVNKALELNLIIFVLQKQAFEVLYETPLISLVMNDRKIHDFRHSSLLIFLPFLLNPPVVSPVCHEHAKS